MKKDICIALLMGGAMGLFWELYNMGFESAWSINDKAICMRCAADISDEVRAMIAKKEQNNG